jgi:hypothetical protein
MTAAQLQTILKAENLTDGVSLSSEVTCGYVCDLLSWVMAHGRKGMAWVTVQTHINVIAVAVLMEFSCVILPEGLNMEEDALEKAKSEGIPVLRSNQTAFELCGRMTEAGILPPDDDRI